MVGSIILTALAILITVLFTRSISKQATSRTNRNWAWVFMAMWLGICWLAGYLTGRL